MRSVEARRPGLRRRAVVVLAAIAVAGIAAVAAAVAAVSGVNPFGSSHVGQTVHGAILLPTNQWVSPLGAQILDRNARLVSSTLSPNGIDVAALGSNNLSGDLTIINVKTRRIIQQTSLATGLSGSADSTVAADGPLYSPDGRTLWVPQSTYLLRFAVNPATGTATEVADVPLCGNPDPTAAACNPNIPLRDPNGPYLPSGMALSPDGSKLYVALNGCQRARRHRHGHQYPDRQDPGRQRAAPGRARRQRRRRVRVQRGRASGAARSVHEPVRTAPRSCPAR